ncbi:hypothetical protein Strain138_002840 [Pseudogemmatithrix spongiicola]|uniref:Uncharacterized protein n=1 Tax=Pseudogemmatithrix spongiicola TaxID=3062599 RepID=A0AA49Q934_9BACT|nr:hypothetical protein Strain138_002150 [Gemmatimonadaceae bacterium 'strain 138']WKW13517.1 hypothetical protein Strain138_002840 [Gemmatimonadaceae bacterium 'strain 138']WKW15747.1 hypothetical protein Strain318_002149 [Gemmatimonadaceae bacterium 'strain 318']WKW16424.1 hypothetical protein Strain318_002840 [Gemmatimonadaceae bacterium 'strain 318']
MTSSESKRSKPRVDDRGRAFAGSQLQVQLYSSRLLPTLEAALAGAINRAGEQLDWIAPAENKKFEELLDEAFINALGLGAHAAALRSFWPGSGPRWDGLARLRQSGAVLLVEGKSYPAEMRGSGCQAKDPRSIELIDAALDGTKAWLGVPREADWKGELYQYANRLAHVRFLRERGVEAWLVNLCFVDDPTKNPTDAATWKSALTQAKIDLGLGDISHVAVDVLLPGLAPTAWDLPAAR